MQNSSFSVSEPATPATPATRPYKILILLDFSVARKCSRRFPTRLRRYTFGRRSVAGFLSCADEFSPKTAIGEKLKRAALSFLKSELSQVAIDLGWDEVNLFGIYNHDDPDVVNRRSDAKGIVPFVALAVWPNTQIERFAESNAVFVTGGGGTFMFPKRDRSSVAFWRSEAL